MGGKSDEEMLLRYLETSVNGITTIHGKLDDEEGQLRKLANKLEGDERDEAMQRQVAISNIKTEVKKTGGFLRSLRGLFRTYLTKIDNRVGKLVERLEKVK